MLDDEGCYRAVCSRDPRFDGWFVTAVTSTGIFCRPSCPALTPRRDHVRFYPTPAAAAHAGFRSCRRCRPDVAPGSPEWNSRTDLVARAMRLIADGVIDREGIPGLAGHLGYSTRQVHRALVAEVGAGPLALARAQRAHCARLLLERTAMPVAEVAFAAGFSSIRQFNDTVRTVYANTPGGLRGRNPEHDEPAAGRIALRLAYRSPLDLTGVLAFLGTRAVPGVEEYQAGTYRRVLHLPRGPGVLEVGPTATAPGHAVASVGLPVVLQLAAPADLAAAVARTRRLLDLDADPQAVDAQLGADPLLAPLVSRVPGRRVPGHVDGDELAVRAVLGQQVSVAGARRLAARVVARYGQPLATSSGLLTHTFPTAADLARVDPAELPLPRARCRALLSMCAALAEGRLVLGPGADRDQARVQLEALPGIGTWTAGYIAMRALGDPDAFLHGDLGVRRALERLGQPATPAAVARLGRRWRPWRAYAVAHLWASLSEPAPANSSPAEPSPANPAPANPGVSP
ncbi:MAG: AlkA N-terminal domain-containing protein [Actinomycetes bacterium]